MFSVRNAVLSLAAISSISGTVFAEHLRVVWSASHSNSIGPPSGDSSHSSSFAVFNDAEEALYSADNPDDHSPCYNTGDGRTFSLTSGCWNQDYQFKCKSSFGGNPKKCEILDADGNSLAEGDSDVSESFRVISIDQEGSCVAEFDTGDDEGCSTDDEFSVA
ncbi:hypothetical protein FZEAL_1909 [Fusarium zealandicum]|uniref:Uncharacterized protein n=1 Tax=Fusarium zealandicum TaxID=1053134 RepID=A0A8H4URT1_9HYPO|nr:hypothetical protein FZEAL_1909 [Fusarium zealandicum]